MGWTFDQYGRTAAALVDEVWQWIQVDVNPQAFADRIDAMDPHANPFD